MNRSRKYLYLPAGFLIALGLASLGFVGCGSHEREKMPPEARADWGEPSAIKVTAAPVQFRKVQRIVGVVGTLHGYEEISLGAKVAGRVHKITHDVSDRVAPGEVLLEIEPTDHQLNVRQAQKSLRVELAKLGLSELPTAKVDVTKIPTVVQAQLKRDNAHTRMERAKSLVVKKAGTEEDLTEKMSDFRVAQAEYDNQILLAKAGIASILVKQEALAIAEQQLKDTVVHVPVPSQPIPGAEDGVAYAISARMVSEGSYIMAGDQLFQLIIENPLKFRGTVPERKSSEVRLNQKANIYTSAYPRPFPGEVTRINPAIDPETRTFEVEILVPNKESELKPGGFAKTAILTEVDDRAATVPLESLVFFAGVTKIFVVEDGHAKEVQVTLGVQDSEWVEVAAPALAEGVQVVTSGQTAIADGSTVTIRAVGESAASLASENSASRTAADVVPPVARREATP